MSDEFFLFLERGNDATAGGSGGPGFPADAYITEDGLDEYVTEDTMDTYVVEV